MPFYPAIDATYTELCREIGKQKLAYVHVMNQSGYSRLDNALEPEAESGFMDLLRLMKGHLPHTALILAGGMSRELAEESIDDDVIDLVAFGAAFISNPDLVARLQNDWPLSPANPATFYGGGAEGYVDYAPYVPS
jgi:2,4-dienoyl-CoA reductase-like NADH-dependent reductase (Old Yellow Enzyme family)